MQKKYPGGAGSPGGAGGWGNTRLGRSRSAQILRGCKNRYRVSERTSTVNWFCREFLVFKKEVQASNRDLS